LSLPAGYRIGLTSLLLLAGAGSVHDATALGDTRTFLPPYSIPTKT
jgi:hypothetical protein